ncbi:hypothetical protein [Allorhodopirellula solitaria]|uniref:Uncharacterized protein n=1 Tax=Allorhodopirellula solitaria TaxID=2527987 RepID=A0A5C5XXA2_9BACT|nr:hypothetical protein [Allorhodopirellula solitaria]TWT67131.1 hypothetical protein CA85_19770 [Allorhodopirellula solitaria]
MNCIKIALTSSQVVAAFALAWFSFPARADDVRDASADVRSIPEAFVANWESVQSYDVLVTKESLSIGRGRSSEATHSYRLILDAVAEKFFMVHQGTRSESISLDDPPSESRVFEAYARDPLTKETWLWQFPDRPQKYTTEGFRESLAKVRLPDVQLVGSLSNLYSFQKNEVAHTLKRNFGPHKKIYEQNRQSRQTDIVIDVELPFPHVERITRRVYRFDTQDFVPLRITTGVVINGEYKIHVVEDIEWKQIDGVFLPVSLLGQSSQSVGEGSHQEVIPVHYDVQFDWRSVNKRSAIDGSLNPSVLLDMDRLLSMLMRP